MVNGEWCIARKRSEEATSDVPVEWGGPSCRKCVKRTALPVQIVPLAHRGASAPYAPNVPNRASVQPVHHTGATGQTRMSRRGRVQSGYVKMCAPAPVPVSAPINAPGLVPVSAPINAPALVPVSAPIHAPVSIPINALVYARMDLMLPLFAAYCQCVHCVLQTNILGYFRFVDFTY